MGLSVDRRRAAEARERSALLMQEFIGGDITINSHPGLDHLPYTGRVVDETQNMLQILPPGKGRARWVPKGGLFGTLRVGSAEIPLRGDALRVRPEDRIKRMAPRGRRARWS
jgi:RNase P/RNase MRP subunit p29